MVSIVAVGALMLLGLGLMALTATIVMALRRYLEPANLSSYYSYVAGVLLIVAAGTWYISPPPNTVPGLLLTFISSFAFALAVLYVALAVYIAQGGGSDGGQSGGQQTEPEADRPLLDR